MLRFSNLGHVSRIIHFSDIIAYENSATIPLFHPGFWISGKPFLFPLILKIFQGDFQSVILFQVIISIFCWSFLAYQVSTIIKSLPLKILSFGFVLAFSLSKHIANWDHTILSESISISLTAMIIGLSIMLLENWQKWKFFLLCLCAMLWVGARDTNAYLLLFSGLILAIKLVSCSQKKNVAVTIIVFIAIFLLSYVSADISKRWVFPLRNVITRRVLTSEYYAIFFEHSFGCKMPMSPELKMTTGGQSSELFSENEALVPFNTWLVEKGKTCFMLSMLRNPRDTIMRPFENRIDFSELERGYMADDFKPLLPKRIENILFPSQWLYLLTWGLPVIIAYFFGKKWFTKNDLLAFFAFLILIFFPHYILIWNGDVIELYRHSIPTVIIFFLGMWLFFFYLLDIFCHNPKVFLKKDPFRNRFSNRYFKIHKLFNGGLPNHPTT
jgi:hypothetical protein